MKELLIIAPQHRDKILQITNKLDKKQADFHVSFIITPEEDTLQLIGGHAPEYVHIIIPLIKNHQLTKRHFTLDGAFFSRLLTYSMPDQPINLTLDTGSNSHPTVRIITKKHQLRSCDSEAFCIEHDEYINKIKQQIYEEVKVADIQRLLLEVDTYSPFQYIDINKDKMEMCVQNDNNQQIHSIPDNIPVALSLGLTQKAAHSLEAICEETKNKSLKIAIHDENITFKTTDMDMTISLAGIEEFYKNKPKEFNEVVSMTIDIYRFKDEIKEYYVNYPKIRKANQSYLLIEPTQLYIANTTAPYKLGSPVEASRITTNENQLYLINLEGIEKIKVKDLTTARELHIAVLKGPEEKFKLGFYKQGNMNYPYASVPIEPAPGAIEEVLAVKNMEEEESKASQQSEASKEPEGMQRDLCFEDT